MLPDHYLRQAETWCSITGMDEFRIACKRTSGALPQAWSTLALAQQVARALMDRELAKWSIDQATGRQVSTADEEIYRCYVLGGCPDHLLQQDGEAAFWLAAQVAELAWMECDYPRLLRAVARLEDLPANPSGAINHAVTSVMWRFLVHFQQTGRFDVDRLQAVSNQLRVIERQGLALHLHRVRNRIHYGSA